jgi:uncharacterized protein
MREVFADTAFWVARLSPRDNLHQAASAWAKACAAHPLVTTDSVLNEVQTFFAEHGANFRKLAAALVERLENDPNVVVLSDHEYMRQARQLYAARPDKGYSMPDCLSMVAMKARGIQCVLTADHHFQQEGFTALLLLSPSVAGNYLP